jgi:hypothetical protein
MELKTLTQIFFSSPFVLALGSAVIPPLTYHCGSLATFGRDLNGGLYFIAEI